MRSAKMPAAKRRKDCAAKEGEPAPDSARFVGKLVSQHRILRALWASSQLPNLVFGKGLDSNPANHDDADNGVPPEHRNREDRSMHLLLSTKLFAPPVLGVGEGHRECVRHRAPERLVLSPSFDPYGWDTALRAR